MHRYVVTLCFILRDGVGKTIDTCESVGFVINNNSAVMILSIMIRLLAFNTLIEFLIVIILVIF